MFQRSHAHDKEAEGIVDSSNSSVLRHFEDVLRVNDEGVKTLLYEIINDDLSGALRGAPAGVIEKFCGRMSARAAWMILENARNERIAGLSKEAKEKLRQDILRGLRRLVDEGKAMVDNPDGPITPESSSFLTRFHELLRSDKNTIRIKVRSTPDCLALWRIALHDLPQSEASAFLSKLPWLTRWRLRSITMRRAIIPHSDDVLLAQLELMLELELRECK